MKKVISIIFTLALLVVLAVPTTVSASAATGSYGPTWTKTSNGEWTYQDGAGTSLVAKLDDNTLYIKGTGAIPSYSRDCLGNRPWHGLTLTDLVIEEGITSIGAEAFSNLSYLYTVTMPVSVFIEDPSAFGGARDECIFNFMGMNISSKSDSGVVPYNSLDSIVDMMVKYQYDYRFRLENYYMIGLAKNSAGGDINNLAPYDATSKLSNPNYPYYDFTSVGTVVNANGNIINGVSVKNTRQGEVVNYIFSLVIGDMTYVTAYNISAYAKETIMRTSTPVQYSISIPSAFRYPGRQFYLIQIGTGEVNILADEDTDDTTVTFTTDYGSTVYALCYKDVF